MELSIKKNSQLLMKLTNIALAGFIIIETLHKTIFGMYLDVLMERAKILCALMVVIFVIVKFFKLDNLEKVNWLKRNSIVFIYFAVRLVSFVYTGAEYTVARSIFFEGVYLLGISELIVTNAFCKKFAFKFLIIANFVLNVFNSAIYFIFKFGWVYHIGLDSFLMKYTCLTEGVDVFYSAMYTNSNFNGMMTGLAIALSLTYISSNMNVKRKIMFACYYIVSFWSLWISNCSNAQLAIIVVALAMIFVCHINVLDSRKISVMCLAGVIIATIGIYGIVAMHVDTEFTDNEELLNTYTTSRYTIWKDSYYSHKDELWLGCGNITLEKRDRYSYVVNYKGSNPGIVVDDSMENFVGPHNGYVGMVSCTGIIGAVLFALALLKKMLDATALRKGQYYAAIIFVLMINLFECMTIVSPNFNILFLFLILAMRDEDNNTEDVVKKIE